ncbi:MAG TPA: hypothetical protein PKH39_06190 [Woeseiaceae bacterium]|nr:hypothetical protein [Woeseiaceae bacterium]
MNDSDSDIWLERLNTLRDRLGTDQEIARAIGVNPHVIGNFRTGRQELPGHAKAGILAELRIPLGKNDYVSLFPPKDRGAAAKAKTIKFPPAGEQGAGSEFWAKVIQTLRERTGAKSDAELARKFGISTSNLSLVRSGKGSPSPRTKFILLDKAGYVLTRDLVFDLLPSKTAEKLREWDNIRFDKK